MWVYSIWRRKKIYQILLAYFSIREKIIFPPRIIWCIKAIVFLSLFSSIIVDNSFYLILNFLNLIFLYIYIKNRHFNCQISICNTINLGPNFVNLPVDIRRIPIFFADITPISFAFFGMHSDTFGVIWMRNAHLSKYC